MTHSRAALERQIIATKGEDMMQREGQLQLYEGEKEFRASLSGWELRRSHGIDFQILETPEVIAEIQPGLDPRFTHAVFTPGWMNTVDPQAWTQHLADAFLAHGGRIDTANIHALECHDSAAVLHTENGPISAPKVIVAAGAWSHHLAHTMGDKIPLETERGYNTTLPTGAFPLRTHLTFGGHGFVVTKINGGVRVGGAVELGGLKLKPNYKRADILLQKAARFMPTLDTSRGNQWMGFRPSMPDSLPVIGPAARSNNILYAFGHGHLGLTQSAGTAELIADLVDNTSPAIPLTAYAATRF